MGASRSTPPHLTPGFRHDEETEEEDEPYYEEDDEPHNWLEGHTAIKFLLAGGIAGAGASLFSYNLSRASQLPQYREHAPLPSIVLKYS